MACIITYENKQYTQKEFEQYFKEHFTEFIGEFINSTSALKTSLGKELGYNDPYVPVSRLKSFKQYEVLDENNNNIGTVVIEYRSDKAVILHPKLKIEGKGYGKDLYKLISNKFNVTIQEWNEGDIANSSAAKKMWDSLEKEGSAKRIFDEEQGDNFRILKYRKVGSKQDIEGFKQYVGNKTSLSNVNFSLKSVEILNSQKEGTETIKAKPGTLLKVKEFLKRNNIDIQPLSKQYGGINGVADLLNNVVQIAEGKEDVALPEEAFHFFEEMLKLSNPILHEKLSKEVKKLPIFKEVRNSYGNDKNYRNADGSLNIEKITSEALTKQLTNEYVSKQGTSILQYIIDWFKTLLFNTYNPFQEVVSKFDTFTGEVSSDQTFYQLDDQKKIFDALEQNNKTYNLQKTVEKTAENDEELKTGYTALVNGEQVKVDRTSEYAKRVNNKKNYGGRDPFEKATEEQKKEWEAKAMSGTSGHTDLENIIVQATDENGLLKPYKDIRLTKPHFTNDAVYKTLYEFMLGKLINGVHQPGYLYTEFPEGSVFKTEVSSYNPVTKRAATMDLIVVDPENNVYIKDYKFMGFSLATNYDIPKNKRNQHAYQMGDYKTNIKDVLKANGIIPKSITANTIPIHATYVKNKTTNLPVLTNIQIGKTDIKQETNTYLIPVIPETQSVGNPKIDVLRAKMNSHLEKVLKKKASPKEALSQTEDIKQLSISIRNLQIGNFEPLSIEVKNFINTFNSLDLESKDFYQKNKELDELITLAKVYKDIDDVFISEYGIEDLSDKQRLILDSLQESSKKIGDIIKTLQNKIIEVNQNKNQEIGFETNIANAERELQGFLNTLIAQPKDQKISTLRLFSKLYRDNYSQASLSIAKYTSQYHDILYKAGAQTAYSKIAKPNKHELIDKISSKFKKDLTKAKENNTTSFIGSHIDEEQYHTMAQEYTKKALEKIDLREEANGYAFDNPEINAFRANQERMKLENQLDYNSKNFNGWNSPVFNALFWSNIKWNDSTLSDEYKKLTSEEKELYNWHESFNQRLHNIGYLKGAFRLYLPHINATDLQKISQGVSVKDVLKDKYISKEEDGYQVPIDPLTNKPLETIPTYFTSSERKDSELSKDLSRIMSLQIEEALKYEVKTNLESVYRNLGEIERTKGHIELDKSTGKIYTEEGIPKVFDSPTKNLDIFEAYGKDVLYNQLEAQDALFNLAVDKTSNKTEEEKEKQKVNLKKINEGISTAFRNNAVGLKLLVAIPNYVGATLQAAINAGSFYTFKEYLANQAKVAVLNEKSKAALDLFVPLNEAVAQDTRRDELRKRDKSAWLKSFSWTDFMQSLNKIGDLNHQYANALSILENTIIRDGKFINIKQWLLEQPKYKNRYQSTIKQVEKELEQEIKNLKKESIPNIIEIKDNEYHIPGIDLENSNYGEYRNKIIEFGRNITGQLTHGEKLAVQRDSLLKSLLMFKQWIIPQVNVRGKDIVKNQYTENWEYGRTRLFFKILFQHTHWNLAKISDIRKATPEGLEIMNKILEDKKQKYLEKNGEELTITPEEFYDMVRKEIGNEIKEITTLLTLAILICTIKLTAPDDDDDIAARNKYKYIVKQSSKILDEIGFYWNPTSFSDITQGNLIPQLGIINQAKKAVFSLGKESYYDLIGDQEAQDKNYVIKNFLNLTPVVSQFAKEPFPLIFPEEAKDLGYKVTEEVRISR